MRSFQQIVTFLFALFVCAFAQQQDTESYDATVYVTSTVLLVNTVTRSGASPTGSVANLTSTISASVPATTAYPTASGNGTVAPTGTLSTPSQPEFTGAASAMNVNALVAVFAAGVGYLVL